MIREFILNYTEYLVVGLCCLAGVSIYGLISQYRQSEEKKKSIQQALLFGIVVGLPLTAALIYFFPGLVMPSRL